MGAEPGLPGGAPIVKSDLRADGLTHVFPSPAALADADLASIGLPRARAETLRRLAEAARDGAASLAISTPSALSSIPGIGPMDGGVRGVPPSASPTPSRAGISGLRRAMGMVSASELSRMAEAFRPFRAYAAMHLWTEPQRSES